MTDGDRFRQILSNRNEVLRVLIERPTRKSELADELTVSRSTIDRAIRELESVECIERTEDGYAPTVTGRLAHDEWDQYRERTDAIHEHADFLELLPVGAAPPTEMLIDATRSVPDSHAPEQALESTLDLLQDATAMRGLAPVVLSFYPDVLLEPVEARNATIEIVAEDEVLAVLPTLPSEHVDRFIEHENVTLYRTQDDLPYALWVMTTPDGEYAGITAYDNGGVAGVLINDRDAAVDWAKDRYESYRTAAEPVPVDRFD